MGKDTDKTKQYKIQKSKKTKNNKEGNSKETKKGKKKKHKILKRVILTIFLLVMVTGLTGVGMVAGIFFSDKWAITKDELIANGNTEVYDADNKMLAILKVGEGDGNRKVVSIDKMGRHTVNAYVAIEDKRFYEHSGIDLLRTAKATVSYALHRGNTSDVGGGSTITQQLVKNLMKDDEDSGMAGVERKIREMSRAYQIESMLTKSQIIEKYLNVIFIGGNNLHGVEYGAQYYFAKSAEDLDLAESAFLAGINDGPNLYDPYDKENDHTERIKNRTKLVLNFMKDQNRISDDPQEAEELYNEAIAKVEEGFEFKKGEIEIGSTSYFVTEAVREVARDLAEQKDISYGTAEDIIKSGGYKLYTTQNTEIQERLIKEMAKDTYVSKRTYTVKEDGETIKKETRTNAGMTIIEHSTGKVVAMAGDLQQDRGDMATNYATSTERQTGSSIKPLANVAPGLEEKVITAATVYNDAATNFGNYNPHNVGSNYGLCTVRKSIERSSNIVNLKIMSNVGLETSIKYLHEFGLNTYDAKEDVLSLAIGGSKNSSSTLQMAAAYATLANGGEYIEPTFYTKLVDSDGKTILEPKQEKRRVISEANAYIVSNILLDVVNGSQGTAGPCAISGMDVAAKTGTTDNKDNKWLCGYTPYYAAATWYGFGMGTGDYWRVPNSKENSARTIWANVMKDIHKGLDKKRFKKPSSVVTAKICLQSGKVATSNCKSTYTEYFATGTVPKECDGHTAVKICKETGKLATPYCPETEEKYYATKPEKEQNATWKTSWGKGNEPPKDTCDKHTEETSKIMVVNVVGKTEKEAKTALAGLTVQVVYQTHADKANGIVLKQSLTEGTKVDKGVTIILTVNKTSSTKPPEGGNTQNPNTNTNTNTNTSTNSTTNNTTTNTQTNSTTNSVTNTVP